MPVPPVSIVVPVYNEVPTCANNTLTPRIRSLLNLLRAEDEIVLVDGRSTDSSWQALTDLAMHPQVRAIQSVKGRARQMNAGAAQAKGDVLLFLHADTGLDSNAWNAFLSQANASAWGRFDVRIEGQSRWLPVVTWFMNHRSRFSKIATGDQALFVGRDLFQRVGGFPDQPLMEDIELCKRLKQLAPKAFVAVSAPVYTSGRRWDVNGAWATIVLMWRFRFQYWWGVPAGELARRYADTRSKVPVTVAVFAKFPEAGRVKTRLEPLLGKQQCAAFARYLLLSTLDKLQGVNVVLWTDGGSPEEWAALLSGRTVPRCVQPQGHLGLRMQAAVETHLASSQVVLLLGPDAVEFTLADLNQLVHAANQQGLAFVPAHDGGYVALACKQCLPEIFSESIHWGTAQVAEQTRTILNKQGVASCWLPKQADIDEPEDFQQAVRTGCVPVDWAERY